MPILPGGVNNIIMWNYVLHLVREKLTNVLPLSPPLADALMPLALGLAVLLQLAASILFMVGIEPRLMAQLLLAFLLPITFTVHDFWTIETEVVEAMKAPIPGAAAQRTVPAFPTEFDSEFVHFFKNIQIVGGLVVFLTYYQET